MSKLYEYPYPRIKNTHSIRICDDKIIVIINLWTVWIVCPCDIKKLGANAKINGASRYLDWSRVTVCG